MKHLLSSADGLRALETLCRVRTLFAFDFDGTLAPIVAHRAAAAMPASTRRLLRQLNALAPVAVVSGRGLKDLRARLALRPAVLIGNHGIEHPASTRAALRVAHTTCANWLRDLTVALRAHIRIIDIEDKRYSLAIHYRAAPGRARTRRAILRAVNSLIPAPRVVAGKLVINLLPPGAPDKGQALQRLLDNTQIKNMLFVGDDVTDEHVFALRDRRVIGVRVGKRVSSRARYYLRAQREIDRVLEHLIHCLRTNTSDPRRK